MMTESCVEIIRTLCVVPVQSHPGMSGSMQCGKMGPSAGKFSHEVVNHSDICLMVVLDSLPKQMHLKNPCFPCTPVGFDQLHNRDAAEHRVGAAQRT